jgi:tRNA dimethylallyltransferase
MRPVVVLTGATASGKSQLALEIARRWPVEIVSADSAQVYRGMDIGTAKPDAATLAEVAHHLIDCVDPAEAYSAARFAAEAQRVIAEIRARGRIPLVVGGTLLYLRALLEGLSVLPSADPALRERLQSEAAQGGAAALHARLATVDPVSAARLHPNDLQRIQRALEIHALSGQPASQLQRGGGGGLPGPVLRYCVEVEDRERLHARIAARFQQMMARGLLDEVRGLYRRGDLHPGLPSIRCVGYRQLWEHLEGRCGEAEAVERGIAATRQLAKRQLTWLRRETAWTRLPAAEAAALAQVRNDLRDADSKRHP